MLFGIGPNAMLGTVLLPTNSKPAASQIYSTNNLNFIEKLLEEADQNTLILWDVDQTLITPDDPILKPKWEKLLDQLIGGKKFFVDRAGKTHYVFRQILMSAPHSLLDPRSVPLIQKLQKKGIPVIAFSAAPAGKIGQVESFIDWRIDELRRFGFDFSPSFSNISLLSLPKDPDLEYPPIFKSGVLITSLHDKGPVLVHFFDALHWQPKKIIFIDDQKKNVESVVQAFDKKIQTIGVHYTAADDLPADLDREAAKIQVDQFLKSGEWVSQQ